MTPNDLLSDIEKMDFDYFIEKTIKRVPSGIDTREGSIIYDALSPAAYAMAEMAMTVHSVFKDTYVQTAGGEFLDYRATERGLRRNPATHCLVHAKVTDSNGKPYELEAGARFASLGNDPIYYKSTDKVSDGVYVLEAEVAGNAANRYVGQVLPIDNMNDFGYGEITSIEIPARDEEDDDSLRRRIMSDNTFTQYGGNVSDYITALQEIEDVGAVQVYPTWNGGGTVKLVVIGNDYLTPTETLLNKVQEKIDPKDDKSNGYGIAPIGHDVTVSAPTPLTIKFNVSLDLEPGRSSEDVKGEVADAINTFVADLRRNKWGEIVNAREYDLTIYRSRLMASLLQVNGIINVADLRMNGKADDISMTFNGKHQDLPIVGEVVVSG
jgi:uncharacterized phage protein gp47/JayE